jgi:hypothetical protein
MDFDYSAWMDSTVNDCIRKNRYRRDRLKGTWNGYSSSVLDTTGSDEKVRDDIRRRERMAEAMYEV